MIRKNNSFQYNRIGDTRLIDSQRFRVFGPLFELDGGDGLFGNDISE
jgi:hypothetical protein